MRRPNLEAHIVLLIAIFCLAAMVVSCKNKESGDGSVEKRSPIPASSNYQFTYEHWMEPKVWALRKEENLDSVIEDCKTDLEIFERLTAWSRRQFQPGNPDPYPMSNGLDILKDIRSGKTGGFCAQYTYLLADALKSFGFFDVRYVETWKDPQSSHFLLEAWSNQYNSWILLDPLYAALVTNKRNQPLSAWDVHAAVAGGKESSLQRKWLTPESETPREPDSTYFTLFRLVALSLRNDLAAADHPWTIKERERDFLEIQSRFLKGPYRSKSNQVADFQSSKNTCSIQSRPGERGTEVQLANAGTCAHFDYFEIKTDLKNWTQVPSRFDLKEKVKWIQCRTVNKMGIRGVIAKSDFPP